MTLLERMARAFTEEHYTPDEAASLNSIGRAGVMLHVGRLRRMAETGDPRLAEHAAHPANAAALAVLREEQAPDKEKP